MTVNLKFKIQNSKLEHAALLWDESFLWGVMAYQALRDSGLSCEFVRCEEIRSGRLKDYQLLFVPGGWASNKMKALGDAGVEEIRQFVHAGGSYLGFCGGAGLATMDGIGLLPVKRRPTKDRVPSFSGPIMLNTRDHSLWRGIEELPVFHAWWPSQFVAENTVSVLATYGKALPGAFSSDLNVGDTEANAGWSEWERTYQINLDPARLLNEPAVIEGKFGAGKVLLSLLHFDTPDDLNGARVLRNIWKYLLPDAEAGSEKRGVQAGAGTRCIEELEAAIHDLIALGERNFLWYWRNPLLLQWRRGVRGLEYCTLFILAQAISEQLKQAGCYQRIPGIEQKLLRIGGLVYPFVDKAKLLLMRERFAIQNTNITYERCDDPEIQRLREELFSRSKSHGGLFKIVADALAAFLYSLLASAAKPDRA